jgi:hypothetical protein
LAAGARAHYDRRRDAGDRHASALRNLFGRMLGCLHHCLATGQHYDEVTAFPPAPGNFRTQLDTLTASDVLVAGAEPSAGSHWLTSCGHRGGDYHEE